MGEEPGAAPDQTSRVSEDELLLQAASVLRMRYERGAGYADLTPEAAAQLGDALTGVATAEPAHAEIDRRQAVALAHRLLDDDNPELSSMWPTASG